jgi:DNA-binding MarR family transcriptional regulator
MSKMPNESHEPGAVTQRSPPGGAAPGSVAPEDVAAQLHAASRALVRLIVLQARASGLGMLEFLVLARAADPEGVTSGEAARYLDLTTSTMTGIVDRLERDQLVRRHPYPEDRRVVLLKATAKGQRLRNRTLGPILASVTAEASDRDQMARAAAAALLERVMVLINAHADALQDAASPRKAKASGPRRLGTAQRASRTPKDHTGA